MPNNMTARELRTLTVLLIALVATLVIGGFTTAIIHGNMIAAERTRLEEEREQIKRSVLLPPWSKRQTEEK